MGASTYVAHAVGRRSGRGSARAAPRDGAALRRELRAALPTATAAGVPAALLTPAWAGVTDADPVLVLVLALVDIRLALLGSVVAWMSGECSSARLFLAGAVLTVVAAAAAALTGQLTH